MPQPRVKLLPIETHLYSAMLDAYSVITALMKRSETICNLPWADGNLISLISSLTYNIELVKQNRKRKHINFSLLQRLFIIFARDE